MRTERYYLKLAWTWAILAACSSIASAVTIWMGNLFALAFVAIQTSATVHAVYCLQSRKVLRRHRVRILRRILPWIELEPGHDQRELFL